MHEQLKLGMKEIGASIGFHPVYITNLYGLRRLTPFVRAMMDPELDNNRQLSVTAAIEICRLPEEHQGPLALRVIRREVNLRTLRDEVIRLSNQHGIPVKERAPDAADQRRAIERKIDLSRRQVGDLKGRLTQTPMRFLTEWGSRKLIACRVELVRTRDDIDASLKILDQVMR
jgi:hypothetical protein